MSNPSPLIPQGSLSEQKNKSRARFKIAVFFVLAFHGVGLLALLLMPGCGGRDQGTASLEPTNAPSPVFTEPSNPPTAPELVTTATTPSNPVVEPTTATTPTTTATAPTETTPITTPTVPSTAQEHTIVKGDSFATLATKYGVKVKDIAAANPGVDSSKLRIGKTLHIPAPKATTTATPTTTTSAGTAVPTTETPDGGQIYTVKSGDVLSRIASQHGTTAKALRAANHLKTDRITVGQKLKIPGKTAAPAAAPTTPAEPVSAPAAPTGAMPAR
jgi:LysM repeat protein